MSLQNLPCERCGANLVRAEDDRGRPLELEEIRPVYRLVPQIKPHDPVAVPMANLYVPHEGRCPGEPLIPEELRS